MTTRTGLRLRDVLALATVGYVISVSTKVLVPKFYSDIYMVYYRNVLPTTNGIPYHAYFLEYPAIPAILIWVSGLAGDFELYMLTMSFLMFFFMIAAVYFLYRTCAECSMDLGRIVPFFILTPSFLANSFANWDITAVCFVAAAIYYELKKKSRLSGLCLGLGFAAKAYPLLLLPVFLKDVKTWNDRFEMFLATVLGTAIPNLPFILTDFNAWLNSNLLSREAVYSENSLVGVIRYYGWMNQDWLVNAVVWSLILLTILHVTFSSYSLVLKSWLIVAVTILLFPSYPPQYNLWLLPMFALSPVFPLIPFLTFDLIDVALGLSWFTVSNPFQAWGLIWDMALARIGLLAALVIWAIHQTSKCSNIPQAQPVSQMDIASPGMETAKDEARSLSS